MYRIFVLVLIVAISSACVPSIMVSTQRDLTYQLDKDTPLYLELGNDVSISEKNTHVYLQNALERSGFKLAPNLAESKIVMTFEMLDVRYVHRNYLGYPYAYFPRHYWYPYDMYPYYYPSTWVENEKAIKLRLFDSPVYKEGKRIPLWEGTVVGDINTIEERLQQSLDVLVDKIGVDFEGNVRLRSSP